MLSRCRLLVDAIFGEAVVEVRALRRVVDHFKALFDLGTLQDLTFCSTTASTGVKTAWAVGLGIVSSLTLTTVLSNKVVYADDFDLCRSSMSRVVRTCAILTDATPLEASIEEFLLTFKLVLYLRNL